MRTDGVGGTTAEAADTTLGAMQGGLEAAAESVQRPQQQQRHLYVDTDNNYRLTNSSSTPASQLYNIGTQSHQALTTTSG